MAPDRPSCEAAVSWLAVPAPTPSPLPLPSSGQPQPVVYQTIIVQVPPEDNEPNWADVQEADWTMYAVWAAIGLSLLTLRYLRQESRDRREQRAEQQATQARQVNLDWSIASIKPRLTSRGSIEPGTVTRIVWRVVNPSGLPLQYARVRLTSLVEPDRKPFEWVREELAQDSSGYWDPAHELPPRYAADPKRMFKVEFDFRDADGLWWKRDGLKPPVRYLAEPWHIRLWDRVLASVRLRRI